MSRLHRGCAWFVGMMGIASLGLVMLQGRLASDSRERDRSYAKDRALDRVFNARAPTPLEVRVMIGTAHGGYQVPADQPSFHYHVASLGKLPVIIVLPGCAFPVWGQDVPENVAVLSVDENPELIEDETSVEACMSKDSAAIQRASERQLGLLTKYVKRAAWIDQDRVMIAGYGEDAPLIARYSGPAKQRLTWGDPCLVPWKGVSTRTPILMLFTSSPQGLMRDDGPQRRLDIVAIAKGAGPSFPRVKQCAGLARPNMHYPTQEVITPGKLDMFERPAALLNAQKEAYDRL